MLYKEVKKKRKERKGLLRTLVDERDGSREKASSIVRARFPWTDARGTGGWGTP